MEQVVCKNIPWEKISVWCCGSLFPFGNIKQHQEEVHSDNAKPVRESYICGVCGKSFSQRCAARIHERIHKSQFTCDSCKKGFRQKSFLKKHKKVCQSSVTTDRIVSERSSACANQTKEKIKEGKRKIYDKEICNICGASVASSNMAKHVKQIHTVNDAKNFSCEYCGKTFKHKQYLTRHTSVHTGHHTVNDAKNFSCEYCGKTFKHKQYLTRHTSVHTSHHTVNDAKNFSCEYCGKTFKHKQYLTRHTYVHTGQKKFSCSFCEKGFREKFYAKKCENQHNGIFKYSCHLCEYKTNGKWNLNCHVNTHLKIKPYSCPVCKFKTGQNRDVRRHVRTQHDTDGSVISQLEALYPQMYKVSESNEGWRDDPLFKNLGPAKRIKQMETLKRINIQTFL